MTAQEIKALCKAYFANIGRGPVDGEAEEFRRAFESEDAGLVRAALDEYLGSGPQWPSLAGLRRTLGRLKSAAVGASLPAPWVSPPVNPEEEATAAESFARFWETRGDHERAKAARERAAEWRAKTQEATRG